jgi:hypothetical protein
LVPFFLLLVKVKRSLYRFSEMEGRRRKDIPPQDGSVFTGDDVARRATGRGRGGEGRDYGNRLAYIRVLAEEIKRNFASAN